MAQRYKNGLVIQDIDSNVSAFMEKVTVTVEGTSIKEASLPAGIGAAKITGQGEAGGYPIPAESLPEAGKDYENLVYCVEGEFYICLYNGENYQWEHLTFVVEEDIYLLDADSCNLYDIDGVRLLAKGQ